MIQGKVTARGEAVVRLRICGPGGAELEVNAVVDTGFSSSLTLPAATVVSLRLMRQSSGQAVLADGSVRMFDIYAVEVSWGGDWRTVMASAIGEETLLGMRLLANHELSVVAVPDGRVRITPRA